MFQSPIVAVDLSESAVDAIRLALQVARAGSSTLRAVHVIHPDTIEDLQEVTPATTDEILAQVRSSLEGAVAAADPGDVPVEIHVRVGAAFEQLAAVITETSGDLLVLGSHGESAKTKGLGPVAARCLHRIPVPVLVVRPPARVPCRRLAACVDFSATSILALKAAAELARRLDTPLDVVHAFYPTWMKPTHVLYNLTLDVSDARKAARREEVARRLENFIAGHADLLEGIEINPILLERGYAAYAINEHVRDEGVDLVVIGTRSKSGAEALLLGGTAERVLHQCPAPVLAVKPPSEAA